MVPLILATFEGFRLLRSWLSNAHSVEVKPVHDFQLLHVALNITHYIGCNIQLFCCPGY